jgi:hypothetical protein
MASALRRVGEISVSQITKHDYDTMTTSPDSVSIVVANTLGEGFASESLITLKKVGNKVKSQFSFHQDDLENQNPLTYAFLFIDGDLKGSYLLKPPITDIRAVKALNVEWEI